MSANPNPGRTCRPRQRAAVGAVKVLAVALLALAGAGWTRPLGDLGRPAPSVLHDEILPRLGPGRSDFNLTDAEVEMADRLYRFEVAAHYPLPGRAHTPARAVPADEYYRWIRQTHYQSSTVRYATMIDHIAADVATLPATFAAICRVVEIDRQRGLAVAEFGQTEQYRDVARRQAENGTKIARFVGLLTYRHLAYDYALTHLVVETPDPAAQAVDAALVTLLPFVDAARRHDFCGSLQAGRGRAEAAIPSRYSRPQRVQDEGEFRK